MSRSVERRLAMQRKPPIGEPDHPLGYRLATLKARLAAEEWAAFSAWYAGQTGVISADAVGWRGAGKGDIRLTEGARILTDSARSSNLVFVDCEADGGPGFEKMGGACPALHRLTQIGAITMDERTFYRDMRLDSVASFVEAWRDFDDWLHQVIVPWRQPLFVSDNPAYDWQWVNDGFHRYLGFNPFGHSARRIGDFYAGLVGDFWRSSEWKRLRVTKHTHYPVDDARGNLEAFRRMLNGERVR